MTALLLLLGAALFFYSSGSTPSNELNSDGSSTVISSATISGALLMFGYLAFDAFTPNWQKKLFEVKPKISRYQVSRLIHGAFFR